jgi:hypothetical protein
MTATTPIDQQGSQQGSPLLEQLEQDDFFGRWETAWNTHDLDLLGTLVAEDIVCKDPAMFGQRVESRAEFRAFIETLFRAFPDVHFEGTGALYLALEGNGIALPWRMKGTFTGEMAVWSKNPGSEPATTAPTGRAFDLEGVDLYEFRDGLLADYSIVYDLLGFSAQIGLMG